MMAWNGWEEVRFWVYSENDLLEFDDGINVGCVNKKKGVKDNFCEVKVKLNLG